MIHTLLWLLLKARSCSSNCQDKLLPDPNAPLSSTIPAAAVRDDNDAHTQFGQQIQGCERKRSRGSYVKLTPDQQAQIAKYALANGNKLSASNLM